MADTQVKDETFLSDLDFDGDERLYAVDDPTGTPADRYVRSRAMWNPSRRSNRQWGVLFATGYGATAPTTIGYSYATIGTLASGSAIAYAATSERTKRRRVATTTGTAAGAGAGRRLTDYPFTRGDDTGRGGFRVLHRFAFDTLPATYRAFAGVSTQSTPGNADPSSWTSMIGFGKDAADTAWQIMCNDGSGTASKVALNTTDFPLNDTSSVYELELYCAPGNLSNVTYKIRRITGVDAYGEDTYAASASGTLSTDLPAAWTVMTAIQWINNDVNAAAAIINTLSIYYEAYGG